MCTDNFNEHEYITNNVLSSVEVSEILNVSRQRLSSIVKEGKLVPAKRMPQGSLFLKSDVEAYLRDKKLAALSQKELVSVVKDMIKAGNLIFYI